MKVCILTTSFPRHPGDYAGNFVFQLAEALTKQAIEVQVVAPYETGLRKKETLGEVEVQRFAYAWPYQWQRVAYLGGIPSNLRRYWQAWIQLPFFLLFFLFRSYRACKECDVIHAYWLFAGFVGLILSRLFRKPLILTVQGSDINFMWGNSLLRVIRRFVLEGADRVIAVSNELAHRVQALSSSSSAHVTVIPNGVDNSVFDNRLGAQADFGYRLVWTGRMSDEKGLEHLINALPRVLEEYPDTTLTLVGDGPLREVVTAQIKALGIGASVRLPGRVTHEQVVNYLREADAFVFSSLNEGLPLSLLEAMSVGLPVIASRVGGTPDVVITEGDAQNGVLVPPGDPAALAEAISCLFASPEAAKEMGQAGRNLVHDYYSWTRIAGKTVELYADVRRTSRE